MPWPIPTTLGIQRTAGEKEVKSAYRQLAKSASDRNKDNPRPLSASRHYAGFDCCRTADKRSRSTAARSTPKETLPCVRNCVFGVGFRFPGTGDPRGFSARDFQGGRRRETIHRLVEGLFAAARWRSESPVRISPAPPPAGPNAATPQGAVCDPQRSNARITLADAAPLDLKLRRGSRMPQMRLKAKGLRVREGRATHW